MLRTLAKQGYLLDLPVAAIAVGVPDRPEPLHRFAGPSIAVLPFTEEGGGGGANRYFAEGISADLLTGLCRIRWLHVIARGSSFLFKGDHIDLGQVERQLGVRFVLQGSIQIVDERVRIHCQLRDAEKERYVWADRFEGKLADIFDLQDRITEEVVGAVEPTIRLAEVERARGKPTESLDAYDLYLRALPLHMSSERRRMSEAQKLLARAVELDPSYSLAKAFAALTTVIQANQGWATDVEREAGVGLAREALADHRDDPVILRCVGHALAYLAHEHERGLALLERALALHPNSAEVHQSAGWVWNFACDGSKALPHFVRAMRLSPMNAEFGHTLTGLTFTHLLLGCHEDALDFSRKAVAAMPNSISPLRAAIFALCELGRTAEARETGRGLSQINPLFRVGEFGRMQPFKDPAFARRYMQALRNAGLPE